jgi:thiamine-phosphate pyrophosphorylase
MVRYAITTGGYGLPQAGTESILKQVHRLAQAGLEFLQLREKHLPAGELANLAREILAILASYPTSTRLLINARADVALAIGAHGVHLTSTPGSLTPTQIRTLYRTHGLPAPTISKACHTRAEVTAAFCDPPDLILFSPVFGKTLHLAEGRHDLPGTGLEELATACALAHPIPVLALGGVTELNKQSCLHAGAAGIAGIRLFAR